jgi:hypothetical protein
LPFIYMVFPTLNFTCISHFKKLLSNSVNHLKVDALFSCFSILTEL